MAGNMKEIKERIGSVKNTNQITRAMNIISSTKFKRYQELTLNSREYAYTIDVAFDNLVGSMKNNKHVIFDGKKEVRKIGVIMMTSDRGLCGSFNTSTFRKFEEMQKQFKLENKEVSVITIGKKAKDYCKSKGILVDAELKQLIPEIMFEKGREISEKIVDLYMENHYDEVYLLYSRFISAIKYNLEVEKVLPIKLKREYLSTNREYIFEPSEGELLRRFTPKALNIKLYQALLENTASEHSARMSAMQQASDNAQEMINKLTLKYNRERQAAITQELTEIVGGANALK